MPLRRGVVMTGHFRVSRTDRHSDSRSSSVGHKQGGKGRTALLGSGTHSGHGAVYSKRVLCRLQAENAKLREEAFKLTIEIRRLRGRV
jgi:hypothetical protein